jgi:UDP-N-acetylglucosamine--N-acetylmuramyl-(pentapeptide) pyrophosphoryl-undecaprenol N-acetylglucosamine transferase
MLLEQNAIPGLTNRMLGSFVKASAVTFESTASFFGAKAIVSGNPVRPEFLRGAISTDAGSRERRPANVLVYGGSQGAHAINMAMIEAAPDLAQHQEMLRLTHQTGAADVDTVRAAYRKSGMNAEVEPFFFDMGDRLSRADLIVCRAGATALAEIAVAAKPAILIPLPTATDDHQRKNAEALASGRAAELLLQREATGSVLAGRILALVADDNRRREMAEAVRRFARPDAARVIVDRALELAAGS